MKIKDFLKTQSRATITIGPDDSVQIATQKLVEHNIGVLPVCDAKGTLKGIVSERDLLKECSLNASLTGRIKVKDIMSKEVTTASPEDDLDYVMKAMTEKKIRHLPIVAGTKVEGMISSLDALSEQLAQYKVEVGYLSALQEAARAINSTLNSEEAISTIVKVTSMATKAKGCSVMLLEDQNKYLTHRATYGLSDEYLRKGVIMADRILEDTMKGKPIIVSDVTKDPRHQYPMEAAKEGIASTLSVPLNLRGTPIGVIRIYYPTKREFDTQLVNLLSAIAELSAIAIEKARIHDSLKEANRVCRYELACLTIP